MSTSGQGDQITETNKDDEPEISSTTSENEGLKETVGNSNDDSAAAAVDPEDTDESKAVEIVASDLPSSSLDKNPGTDAVTASTAAEIEESSDIMHEGSELKAVVRKIPPEAGSSDVTRETDRGSLKPDVKNDIPEIIHTKSDKDSSIEEDQQQRWDVDDDANNDATEPKHTDYVLEMLNKELGEEALEKPDTYKIISEEGTIKSVNDTKSDKHEDKDVIKAMTDNESFEESQKIIAEIDSLTQDDEIDKTTELSTEFEDPVTVDESVNQLEDNKTSKDAVELEKPDIEKSKPETVSIEIPLKPLTKESEEMDVDDSGDITQEKKITEGNDILNVAVTASDLYEESQKPVPQLDSLTQDGIDKTLELPTSDLDKQLDDVEIPNELIESEKLNFEELVTKTVSVKIPFKPLTIDDEEMDIDKSGENKKRKDIVKLTTTATVSFEECQKTIAENVSLTQGDKIEKTAELSSKSDSPSDSPVTVDELDKQLSVVDIKNESDKSEKPDIEESQPETKVIEVPSKLLTKDDEVMDFDDSNNVDKDTSTVDDFSAEVTKPQENTLVSVQKAKVESVNDMEVLDIIEDKQDTSSHDIIAEVLKPAETVTSEHDISSTDKTILKGDTIIPIKDEQNRAIEDISEISQPVDDKNKESDAIQDLDDELSTEQSIDNKSNDSQDIDDTASVQDGKKSSDEQNIAHKSSESQVIDDKVTSTQEIDDETLKAKNILVNTEIEDKLGENPSILDDSLIDTTISPNKHHRINKPNVMLDIPTQELSDIEAELSDSEINDDIEKLAENTENVEKHTKIDEKPLESNKIMNVMPEISGIAAPAIEIDATTSKLNITTISPLKLNQASSKDVKIDDKSSTKTQDILTKNDGENVAEKISQEVERSDDDKPSSSKDIGNVKLEKLTMDDADEVQESDSLGLLAESSRVPVNMDDDIIDDEEEPEDLDPDDNDDDEDFDPYDESSSQMLEDLQDTDESNPAIEEKMYKTGVIDADEQTNKQEGQPDKITNILEKVLGNKSDLKQPSMGSVLNYVEVEGSSDSDDVEEISKPSAENLISVKVPAEVDVMLTSGAEGGTSAMHSNKDEVVISVPKPQSLKVAKINTSEVTIKSASKNLETIQIPETTTVPEKNGKEEVFNIDSDDEEEKNIEELPKEDEKEISPEPPTSPKSPELPTSPKSPKCINPHCTDTSGVYSKASRATIAYYSQTRRSGVACQPCTEKASERSQALVNGIKDLRPLMALDMEAPSQQLVEISDSDEDEEPVDESEKIGEKGAKFILNNLVDVFNEVWAKYELDDRLKHAETYLNTEMDLIAAGAEELNEILDEIQMKTDAIRTDFYKDYVPITKHLGGIVIHDTPFSSYSHTEKDIESVTGTPTNRYPKRRSASNLHDPPAKKHAFTVQSMDREKKPLIDQIKMEDDKDISVVKLSAESAPASLPPHGDLVRPALLAGMSVYAMRNAFGTWNKARILEIVQEATPTVQFTQCRVKFEHKVKNSCKVLAGRSMAYSEPCEVRYTIGTRVVALFKDPQSARLDAYYAGVVAEVPNPVNNYRYLVFFDDGYAQYIQHADTRLVCETSALVWEEVHPFIRDFVKNYLKSYPERPMVRLRQGETLNTEWNGKWWTSRVMKVDASIALIHFHQDNRTEWIYRGSTRLEPLYLELQAAKAGGRSRLRLPRTKQIRSKMPCVEYTRSDEQENANADGAAPAQGEPTVRRERAVAKKSTTDRRTHSLPETPTAPSTQTTAISRVVYYTPKYATKPLRMEPHTCNPTCGRRADILPLEQLRTYNPLAKPLLSGWERQTIRYRGGHRAVVYRAPCGRRLRNMPELHRWLCLQESDFSVDLFDFTPGTHCLAEFVLDDHNVGKKDLSHGQENVPVPCVNYYDDSLPDFCTYNTERTPTAGVPLNLDPDFLCGCDCTDDCQDKTKCACWKMTLEGARTIGIEGDNVGYVYRRLPEPLPSGIYECNSRCNCKKTCLNRVAQHPLQLKLQVFKTLNRGWGIRALNDVPKGSFLCVYAGNLLTDATANLDGLNEGDEYLAELDYIEVVEGMKEGYEDDVPETDKAMDKNGTIHVAESESESSSESEEEKYKTGKDDDFQPNAYFPQPQGDFFFEKSLRKREKAKKKEEEKEKEKQKEQQEAAKKRDDCITISDDEEVREPSRFTADDIADKNKKRSSRVSVRKLYGKDEACYIMDAKVQGNIGRYLNHSCLPNVFVQNVFVDTHDPRFPWVAFFALTNVRAGNELTWNYNYDVGSVPGKVLYCFCGAPGCRGRLL